MKNRMFKIVQSTVMVISLLDFLDKFIAIHLPLSWAFCLIEIALFIITLCPNFSFSTIAPSCLACFSTIAPSKSRTVKHKMS